MSNCYKCEKELIDVFFIECSAYYCSKKYHFDCIGVTSVTKDVVLHNKNVRWFCDLCLEEPLKPIILGLDAIYSKILSLESQFQKFQQNSSQGQRKSTDGVSSKEVVTDTLISNKGNVGSRPGTANAISNNENLNKNKRKSALFKEINSRGSSVTINDDAIEIVSGPSQRRRRRKSVTKKVSSCEHGNVVTGSKVPVRKSIVGSETTTEIKVVKPAESIKYIHVKRIDSSTSDQSLTEYLATKLAIDAERLRCFRISSNLHSRFEMVSFKIGVPSALFDDVFKPEIWPSGVMVREFVHMPHKKVAKLLSKNSSNPPSRSNI